MVWSPSTTWVFLYSLLFHHPSLKFTAGLLFNRLIPQDGLAWSSSPSVCIGHCVHFLRGLQLFTMIRQEGGKRDRLPGWGRFSQQEGQLREEIHCKTFSFGHCPNYLNPPPHDPNSGNLVLFFGSRNSRFESQFRTKNTIYTI